MHLPIDLRELDPLYQHNHSETNEQASQVQEEPVTTESTPPETPVISETVASIPAIVEDPRCKEITENIKIFVPIGSTPQAIFKLTLEAVLKKCGVTKFNILRQYPLPRAEYEEQISEWKAEITITVDVLKKRDEILSYFLERFCFRSGFGFHDQVFIEVPHLPSIVPDMNPQHVSVPVALISIGNCPNPGLFFVRGDYISGNNQNSNKYTNAPGKRDESSQFKVAGTQEFLSFAHFEHDRRQLSVFFASQLENPHQDGLAFAGFKLLISYQSIVQIVVNMSDSNYNTIFLKVKYPPQLWEAIARSHAFQQKSRRYINLEQCRDWVRVLQWPGDRRSVGCSRETLADSQYIRLSIVKGHDIYSTLFLRIVSRLITRSSAKVHFGAIYCQSKRLPIVPNLPSFGSFRTDYALKAIISRGSVVTDQLFPYDDDEETEEHPLFMFIRYCMKECQLACEESLENLLCAIDERRTVDLLSAFRHMYDSKVQSIRRQLLDDTKRKEVKKPLPKNCVLVRKVMVTPLRILFMAPEVMMTNRVIRYFGEENALRCVFRDDSLQRLNGKDFVQGQNQEQQSAIIAGIVQRTLSHGVQIHDRTYYFLAWSNSQMRDHGCYMYSPNVDPKSGEKLAKSIDEMRKWMGDFSSSRNVPKLMSRMGQCFTQAQPSIILTTDMWTMEPDIEGGVGHPETKEPYCYSDGCGRISVRLARKIAEKMLLPIIPSCFQVRFKGFKGVLAIDPAIDLVGSGPEVIFRKSQQKFIDDDGSKETMLEIVKQAMPSPVCLNRPMITILDHVSEKQSAELHHKLCRKIHYYLERELARLGAMLLEEKSAAEELTQRINLSIDFVRLRSCGFTLTNEPFFRKMLVAVYRFNIHSNLSKTKIFLPSTMGRSMYGVIDETGLLQYGQVFIQYSPSIRQASDKPVLFTGRVLITKNPCHAGGDVRMFDAVDQPALRHLFDVVVFPRYGPRPHPDEMAGSDLDGDEYCVVFDKDIAFDHNEAAMIFPKSTPMDFDSPPTTEDMTDFFLKYLKQDSIGRMSNAHLVMSDKLGLDHEITNDIARKCAVAVDFPKTGEPAEPLAPHETSDTVPDYIHSPVKPPYRSKRLNGQLFRKIKKVEEVLEQTENIESIYDDWVDDVLFPPNYDVKTVWKQSDLAADRKLRDEYATRMQLLLDEYGISDEASVVSGSIVTLKRLTAMERDDYSYYHTEKIVELRYSKIFNHFREAFFQEFGGEEMYVQTDRFGHKTLQSDAIMQEKARRWYYLAYVENTGNTNKAPGPCRSFPWIVWDVLALFKRDTLMVTQKGNIVDYPIAPALNNEMNRFVDRNVQDYTEFYNTVLTDENPVVRLYTKFYGPQLAQTFFILYTWLKNEEIFSITQLTITHVCLLFIQFCRGIRHGCHGVADSPEMFYIFKQEPTNDEEPLPGFTFDMARTLIAFIRYISSQRFCLSEFIALKVDKELHYPVLLRPNLWMPLAQVAFRTYHHLAVSGRFDALHITHARRDWSEGESKEPMVVSGSLFSNACYRGLPVSNASVLQTLKLWSGVSDIMARTLNQNKRNEVVLVTSVGTVAARQRLARLLLMPPETLKKAIRDDCMPTEVYDFSP